MSQQVKHLKLTGAVGRLALVVAAAATLAFGWFGVRWQLGNMFGDVTPPGAPDAEAIAVSARGLSPYDPTVNWLLATTRYNPADDQSIREYADALKVVVALAPNDFRWWVELARAYEQSGQSDLAREAFLKAVSFNPRYAYPLWQYGNFELRQGNADKAVGALSEAAKASAVYRGQLFPMMWEYFEGQTSELDRVAGDDVDLIAGLGKFYASRKRGEDASRVWARLPQDAVERHRPTGRLIAQGLFENHLYRSSVWFLGSLGEEPEAGVGRLVNAGFERPLSEDGFFAWRTRRLERVDVRSDSVVKKSGRSSLRFVFRGFGAGELVSTWQMFPVESGRSYRLRFSVRTEEMKSAGLPTVEVAGPSGFKLADGSPVGLLAKAEVPLGTSDWQEMTIEFVAPQEVEGLQVRINRSYCGEDCPMTGTFWLDDFVLEVVQ